MRNRELIENRLRPLGALWLGAMFTPALYMLIGLAVGRSFFRERSPEGFYHVEARVWRVVLWSVGVVCAALVTQVVRLRLARRRDEIELGAFMSMVEVIPDDENDLMARAAERYRRRTLGMLVLCDAIAFTGLALYLLQGDALSQGVLAIVAWSGYALGKPSAFGRRSTRQTP